MWRLGTCSSPTARRNRHAASRCPGAAFVVVVLVAAGSFGEIQGQTFLTQDEALSLAFPDAEVTRQTEYLTEEALDRARALAGENVPIEQTVVPTYRATDRITGQLRGTAYFDAHRVRTLTEVVMVVVDPEGRVDRVEVLKFAEPPDYLLPERWLDQLRTRSLDDGIAVNRDIINMSGATLSSVAMTRAVRRVLALHRVLEEAGSTSENPTPGTPNR